jgi:hypothetical protein
MCDNIRHFTLIRGGRYDEPVPDTPPRTPPPEARTARDVYGPLPEERAWMARSPDSPFARFDHDKVGA